MDGDRFEAFKLESHGCVILQILADAWQIQDRRDPLGFNVIGRANAREHQQLGRVYGASRKDNFLVNVNLMELTLTFILDATNTVSLHNEPMDHGIGLKLQVAAAQCRAQMGNCCTAAAAIFLGGIQAGNALWLVAVRIISGALTSLVSGLKKGVEERVFIAAFGDAKGTVGSAPVVCAPITVLTGFEVGQALCIAPLGQAQFSAPAVVILWLAPHIDHRVYGG